MKARFVKVNDYNSSTWEGWFHGWTQLDDGKLMAIIERYDDGQIKYVEPYMIIFKDRQARP